MILRRKRFEKTRSVNLDEKAGVEVRPSVEIIGCVVSRHNIQLVRVKICYELLQGIRDVRSAT